MNALHHSMRAFFDIGGPVLEVILVLTFLMWLLLVERYWFFASQRGSSGDRVAALWSTRSDRHSYASRMIRACWLSQFEVRLNCRLTLIKALVSVSLLLGLLGTVTGMVNVFDKLSMPGVGEAGGIRAIADGVAGAAIPAMAGMVTALSGVYFSAQLKKRAVVEVRKLRARLTLDRSVLR